MVTFEEKLVAVSLRGIIRATIRESTSHLMKPKMQADLQNYCASLARLASLSALDWSVLLVHGISTVCCLFR